MPSSSPSPRPRPPFAGFSRPVLQGQPRTCAGSRRRRVPEFLVDCQSIRQLSFLLSTSGRILYGPNSSPKPKPQEPSNREAKDGCSLLARLRESMDVGVPRPSFVRSSASREGSGMLWVSGSLGLRRRVQNVEVWDLCWRFEGFCARVWKCQLLQSISGGGV